MSVVKFLKLKPFLQIFASIGIFSCGAQSLYLEKVDINTLKDKSIAYYPGSFDPLQLGHMSVVDTVLDKDLADYVLIYALPDSDASKNRVPHPIRFSMLESIYASHPKVLITKLMPSKMQDILAPFFKSIRFSVVVGSDIINTYINTSQYDDIWMQGLPISKTMPEHGATSMGAIMAIPAKQVIAFNRMGDDLSYLKGLYKNRPITILSTKLYADLSSTQARNVVKQGGSLIGIVPLEIIKIIQEKKLYSD